MIINFLFFFLYLPCMFFIGLVGVRYNEYSLL